MWRYLACKYMYPIKCWICLISSAIKNPPGNIYPAFAWRWWEEQAFSSRISPRAGLHADKNVRSRNKTWCPDAVFESISNLVESYPRKFLSSLRTISSELGGEGDMVWVASNWIRNVTFQPDFPSTPSFHVYPAKQSKWKHHKQSSSYL